MDKIKSFAFLFILIFGPFLSAIHAQNTIIDGYAFESDNRGYLNQVFIQVFNTSGELIGDTLSDFEGHFIIEALNDQADYLVGSKVGFEDTRIQIKKNENNSKVFIKLEMIRKEGYIFAITLANSRNDENLVVDAIQGANIEVYNNTTDDMELVLENLMTPGFKVQLYKNHHYTILIRKDGYLSKRLEAYVNVEACILCFEGVGDIRPKVSDNLTERNLKGVLLANVELEKVYTGKEFQINNLYYDFGSSRITKSAELTLNDIIVLLKDNPYLSVELGSHTDSRGGERENLSLSKKRAKAAVNYILDHSNIDRSNLSYQGYGESQLINNCSDGVNCSEEEHALNRRTEIKILGIDPDIESISLAERIRQDKEEALIEELLKQEQVYIEADNPKEILEKIDKGDEAIVIDETLDIDNDGKVEEIEKIVKEEPFENDTIVDVKPSIDLVTSANQGEEDLFFDDFYSVAFLYSRKQLDKSNRVWNIQGVREYKSSNGVYIYHVGQFTDEQNAIDFNKLNIRPLYSNSFIVKFIKGELYVNY